MDVENKYVAFCDILGFSDAVTNRFDEVIELYAKFKEKLAGYPELSLLKTSIYSDSIIIVGDRLIDVAKTVQILLWHTLLNGWIIRGGIGYGKHWLQSDENNLLVVSQALVNAVNIEKAIKIPVIAISNDIPLTFEDYWKFAFVTDFFLFPIIHHKGVNIINPFNQYWFNSAETNFNKLKEKYPEQSEKYNYLLGLVKAKKENESFVPQIILDDLLAKGMIGKSSQ